LLLSLAAASAAPQPPRTVLIAGAVVVDGTGGPRRQADVRIEGDRIAAVGRLRPREGETVVRGEGRVLAPGFIDTHSHADRGLSQAPEAATQIRQGVTTAIVGQDGFSNLPLADFFRGLEEKPAALNVASFAGHSTIRRAVLGEDYRKTAAGSDLERMRALVEQEMRSGALGLSTGLEYEIGSYADTAEVIACARAAAAQGGLYISHMRDEETDVFASLRETARIAEEARVPAQVSHIKLAAATVWGRAGEALRLMERVRKPAGPLTADVYPYTYWASTLRTLVPREKQGDRRAWEAALAEVGGPANVRLSRFFPDRSWEGRTLAELAERERKDPLALVMEILERTQGAPPGGERVVVTAMAEEDVRRFLAAPQVMIGSEGAVTGDHPRIAGTYPRILGRYVREERVLTLEEAVRKMTSFPARRMGIRDRGVIRTGMKADLVLFDPDTVIDRATVDDPNAAPVGISHVWVNGRPVLEAGRITAERPGQVVRRAGAGTTRALLRSVEWTASSRN
jgi:N-acyl-D-amino-acid deacylase